MILFLWLFGGCVEEKDSAKIYRFPQHRLDVNHRIWDIDFACRSEEVALGLRYRNLAENEGVFMCASTGVVSMKKMKSPISVAFVSKEYIIQSIISLELQSSDYPIPNETSFVWEMPKGWFERNGIVVGMTVIDRSKETKQDREEKDREHKGEKRK